MDPIKICKMSKARKRRNKGSSKRSRYEKLQRIRIQKGPHPAEIVVDEKIITPIKAEIDDDEYDTLRAQMEFSYPPMCCGINDHFNVRKCLLNQ